MLLTIRFFLRGMLALFVNLSYIIKCNHIDLGYRARIVRGSIIEGHNKIHDYTTFVGYLGKYSYIGDHSHIYAKIGKFCSIGPHVRTISSFHPTRNYVSTHPSTYSTHGQSGVHFVDSTFFEELPKLQGSKYPISIGNDVFIGDGAILVGNIRIGDGAIIAAGSVVVKDVEPYSIVGGNPAVLIRKRFDDYEIDRLIDIKWWDQDEKWLRINCIKMVDIKSFLHSFPNE